MITTTNLLARVRRGRPAQPRAEVAASTAQRGFTTLEAAVASVLLAVTFLAMAGTFSSGMGSAARAKAYDRGAVFLEETMSSIAGQPFDAAVAMNGNRIFNTPSPANASQRIDIAVTPVASNLVAISAELWDIRRGQRVARLSTLRCRR